MAIPDDTRATRHRLGVTRDRQARFAAGSHRRRGSDRIVGLPPAAIDSAATESDSFCRRGRVVALPPLKQLFGEVTGGIVGALMVVPIILSCGIVSFQSLGGSYVSTGIMAAFVSAFFAALFAGVFGYPPLHGNSPKTSHAAILSSLIAGIATHHAFTGTFTGDAAPAALMSIFFITLVMSGATQFLIGAAGLGSIVKFIPHPVLAGFINGFALQIIVGQIPNLVGLSSFAEIAQVLQGRQAFNPYPLCLALFACGLVVVSAKVSPLVPEALIGLIGGTLAFIGIDHASNQRFEFGAVIGQLPTGNFFVPHVAPMIQLIRTYSFLEDWFAILSTGITLALISSIQSLLSISSADELFGTRHDSNKELMVQGAANAVSALFGGTPNGGSPNVTQTMYANGGRTGYANIVSAVVLLLLASGLGQFIAQIPLSVMAGVVILNTAGSMDTWTQQLLKKMDVHRQPFAPRPDVHVNLFVIALVTVLVVTAGALPALGVGMSVSFMIFLYQAKDSVVRKTSHLNQIMSRIDRPLVERTLLAANAAKVAVIELQGPLFFGASDTLRQLVEAQMATADWIILDFKRNSLVDASGAMAVKRMNATMNKARKKLLLACIPADSALRQDVYGLGMSELEAKGRVFEDTDTAVATAEAELLARLGCARGAAAELRIGQFEALQDMTAEELEILEASLQTQRFEPYDVIIKAGSHERDVFFLSSGQASVYASKQGKSSRFISWQAGIVFGESAFFTGRVRSADIVADAPTVVFKLSEAAFERLSRESAPVAIKLLRGLGSGLASHLASTTQLVHELES